MARAIHKLTAAQVKSLPPGKHGDGAGLWLHKRPDGGGQWVLRVTMHGRRREMGLGSISNVSVKEAREAASEARKLALQGTDPIKQRRMDRREQLRNLHLLKDVARDAFASRKAELRDGGKAGRWFSPLELHVLPKIGEIPVAEIDQIDIRDALQPIWHEKADTAKKALNRLAICIRHGAALGLDVDLQAVEKARALLGKQKHVTKHVVAMPWQDVPAFYRSLNEGTITHLALRLLILTAARSKPIRFLHLDHLDGDVWTIPADLMKGAEGKTREFRVPLSRQAQHVIEQAKPFSRDGYLFPSVRRGVISDATMSRLMERRQLEARPHGFRSSFRDWLAEATDTPHDVAETCLAHVSGSPVVRAYRRTDYLEQRRNLHQQWADYVAG